MLAAAKITAVEQEAQIISRAANSVELRLAICNVGVCYETPVGGGGRVSCDAISGGRHTD